MAEALTLDITVQSLEAEASLGRLYTAFRKSGDGALEAHDKVEKFEKGLADGLARKKAKAELDSLAGATSRTASVTDGLTSAVLRYAAPAAAGRAALATAAWADGIADLAQRTKITTTQVQQLSSMAEKNGSSFNAMASMIQTVEQKLGSHNKKAEEAVRLMKLAPEALMRMDPLERLRAIAQGLADMEDPAKRSAAETAILGSKADAAAVALDALAAGADKAESALGPTFIKAGADVQEALDGIAAKAMNAVRAFFLLGPAMRQYMIDADEANRKAWNPSSTPLSDIKGPADQMRAGALAALTPKPFATPGDPFEAGGVGGNSMSFIERALGIKTGPKSRAASEPFKQSTFALGSTMASIFSMVNTPGSFNAGKLPFMSSLPFLRSGAGPISAENGMQLPAGVKMNAPGASGGSWLSKLFGGGKASNIAAGGLGLLTSFLPGLNRTGQSIGSMAGSFLGPMGSALGGLVGGLGGKLFGTSSKKLARNAEVGEVYKQFSSKEFIDMQKEADKFGLSMNKALTAKTMKDFGAAVDEVNEKLREMNDIQSEIDDLTERTKVGFDDMNEIVKEFGLDINKMGPAFKQAAMDKEAQKIIDAFAKMEKGGADMNGVLDGMSDEISKVVQNSIEFGTKIPENMKPWVEKLAETGRLTDASGKKITDVSKLQFGEKLESEMDKFVRKLGELIDKLAGVKKGFNGAQGAASDFNNEAGRVPDGPDGPNIPDPVMPSRGGIIGSRGELRYLSEGGFVPRGTDTVPAMLSPGEMVTPADVTTEIVRSIKDRRDPGDVHILPIFIDGRASDREMVDEVFRQLPRRIAGNDANSRSALQRIIGSSRVH